MSTGNDSGEVVIYTDGACRGNPGPGGWGALMRYGDHERELCGSASGTTNNRMELTAAIEALGALTRHSRVRLVTDSTYVKDGITRWLPSWKKRAWRTAANKPVRNADLWKRLEDVAGRHEIRWEWVRGHTGNAGNEAADRLANEAIDALLSAS